MPVLVWHSSGIVGRGVAKIPGTQPGCDGKRKGRWCKQPDSRAGLHGILPERDSSRIPIQQASPRMQASPARVHMCTYIPTSEATSRRAHPIPAFRGRKRRWPASTRHTYTRRQTSDSLAVTVVVLVLLCVHAWDIGRYADLRGISISGDAAIHPLLCPSKTFAFPLLLLVSCSTRQDRTLEPWAPPNLIRPVARCCVAHPACSWSGGRCRLLRSQFGFRVLGPLVCIRHFLL